MIPAASKKMTSKKKHSRKTFQYQVIEETLLRRIAEGAWKTGDIIVSNREICDEFNVSPITANRVLDKLVGEGVILRRRGIGNILQSRVPSGRPSTLRFALVCPYRESSNLFFDGYYSIMAEAFVQSAGEDGGTVQMAYFKPQETGAIVSTEAWLGYETQGLAFFGASGACPEAAILARKFGLPAIFIDSYLENMPCVLYDHAEVARLLCSKLAGAGHKRIGFVANGEVSANHTNEVARLGVFPAMAECAGLELGSRILRVSSGTLKKSAEDVQAWIREQDVTAIVTTTHYPFAALYPLLSESGLLPSDFTFLGMDNWNPASGEPEGALPFLGGCIADLRDMGKSAYHLLKSHATDENASASKSRAIFVKPTWNEGQTFHSCQGA